jgi:hypothetical protein
MENIKRQPIIAACLMGAAMLLGAVTNAHAVPSYARQTNLDCTVCHLSWLELAPTGRKFKLNGYTLGDRQLFPFAGMLQLSRTSTEHNDLTQPDEFSHDREIILQQASVFAAGKLTDHIGLFSQYTYDGAVTHGSIDNVDLRYVNRIGDKDNGPLFGLTLHNNPTVQDVYNTVPAWGFPFASSSVALAPASTLIDGGLAQNVAGLGAYFHWNDMLYGELTAYRTADKLFSFLRYGVKDEDRQAIKGYNPYWRLALEHEWGDHSAMIGTYGMVVEKYPEPLSAVGPTDRFRDVAFDAQYQYITDKHRFSAQANWVREKQSWNASYPDKKTSNLSDNLDTFRGKLTYYFDKKYGVSAGYFFTKGDADDALYHTRDEDGNEIQITGSHTGSPNTTGYILELNYLPVRDIRVVAQYTGYTKFNGEKNNYDGSGRNAKDNNTLYLLLWMMF